MPDLGALVGMLEEGAVEVVVVVVVVVIAGVGRAAEEVETRVSEGFNVALGLAGPRNFSRTGLSCCCTAGFRSLHSLLIASTPTVRAVSVNTCSAR